MLKLELGLGLGFVVSFLVVLVPIVVGNYAIDYKRFLIAFLVVIISVMGFCRVFSSLLHYMLPRKRACEGVVVEEDSDNNFTSSSNNIKKKLRIAAEEDTDSTVKISSCNDDEDVVCGDNSNSNNNHSSRSVEITEEADVPIMTLGNTNPQDIDEDLHSRQLAVYGRETMRRLFASNVLISGMQGLGAEIGIFTNISF
jgi:ubiquitin-activating enzyme E1